MDSFQLLVDGLPKVMAATEMSKVPKIAIEQMMAVSVGAPFSSPVWSENEDMRQRQKTLKGGQVQPLRSLKRKDDTYTTDETEIFGFPVIKGHRSIFLMSASSGLAATTNNSDTAAWSAAG